MAGEYSVCKGLWTCSVAQAGPALTVLWFQPQSCLDSRPASRRLLWLGGHVESLLQAAAWVGACSCFVPGHCTSENMGCNVQGLQSFTSEQAVRSLDWKKNYSDEGSKTGLLEDNCALRYRAQAFSPTSPSSFPTPCLALQMPNTQTVEGWCICNMFVTVSLCV